MKLLAIDPSSRVTGYAVMRAADCLVEAGVLKQDAKLPVLARIDEMVAAVEALIDEHVVTHVVIEVTSGKTAGRLRKNVQGLAVYGMAIGEIRRTVITMIGAQNVTAIPENEWTKGVPKRERMRLVAMAFSQYKPADDPGGDIADAIWLAMYWFGQRRRAELVGDDR